MDIARKYAYAFLNIFGNKISLDDIIHFQAAEQFLRSTPRALFLLKVPGLPEQVKKDGLLGLCSRFQLPRETAILITLLLKNKRVYLIKAIFTNIIDIYKERKNVQVFMVSSSIELSSFHRSQVEAFLATRITGVIIYKYMVDKRLIAGMRLQSDNYLWEYSLQKQLRDLECSWMQ